MAERVGSVEEAIRRLEGPDVTISRSTPVAGGCIADGTCLALSNGTRLFAKRSRTLPSAMFPAEYRGLEALRSDAGPRVPRPLAASGRESTGDE